MSSILLRLFVCLFVMMQLACSSSNTGAPNNNNANNNNPGVAGQGGGNAVPPTPSPTPNATPTPTPTSSQGPSRNGGGFGSNDGSSGEIATYPGNYMLVLKFANVLHKLQTAKLVASQMDLGINEAVQLIEGVNRDGDILVVLDCITEGSANQVNQQFQRLEANTEVKLNPRCIDPNIRYQVGLVSFKEEVLGTLIGEVGKILRINRQQAENLIRAANSQHPLIILNCATFLNADGISKRLENMGASTKVTVAENCN